MNSADSKEITQEQLEVEKNEDTDAIKWVDDLKERLNFDSTETKPTARMPVDRDSDKYNMNHPKRGKAVIFNHMTFLNGQTTRLGTERDEQNLRHCLNALGFEVIVHRDLRKLELLNILDKLKDEDHSNRDCLLIVVLSHGEQDKIFCADSSYRPEDLWNSFTADNCVSLAGKPKIFLIQACRGDQLDHGTKLLRTQTDSHSRGQDLTSYTVPNLADFLVVYSTAPGYYSWRNTQEGSWFVQSLTKVLSAYKDKKDLLSMMTVVAREVALNFESNAPTSPIMDKKKQVPMISSTLIRDVFL